MIDYTAKIHVNSIVEHGAIVKKNVVIGPFCFVGPNVEIDEGTILKSNIVVDGYTYIGKNNQIYQFSSIGAANQDLKYSGEPTCVKIGDRNCIREGVTIHRGTIQVGGLTRVGNDNLLMVNAHIAHDCIIGNHCIFSNHATLGGHVTIDDFVIIGGMSAIHQWCTIGTHVMVGGCSGVAQDIPPYVVAQGNHAIPFGINVKGLKRSGFNQEMINVIRDAYKLLYRSNKKLDEAKLAIKYLAEQHTVVRPFYDFFDRSTRGLIR